jgi:hypothetical protein
MWAIVPIMGLVIVVFSLWLIVRTEQLTPLLDKFLVTRWIYLGALARLLLGAGLIASAHTVKFTELILALGWLLALGGLLLVALPQVLWIGLGRRFAALPIAVMRAWLMFALLFGIALLYVAFA